MSGPYMSKHKSGRIILSIGLDVLTVYKKEVTSDKTCLKIMSSNMGFQVFSRSSCMVPKLLAFTKMYAGVYYFVYLIFLLKVIVSMEYQ